MQSEFDKAGARPASPIQRLWRFNADGTSPQLILPDINPVGYHAWMDADQLVLFVLGGQANRPRCRSRASRQGRPRSPPTTSADRCIGSRARGSPVSCSVKRPTSSGSSRSTSREENRSAGQGRRGQQRSRLRVDARRQDHPDVCRHQDHVVDAGRRGWTEVFDGAPHQLGAITRLAVSPKGDAVAIVVAEPTPKK